MVWIFFLRTSRQQLKQLNSTLCQTKDNSDCIITLSQIIYSRSIVPIENTLNVFNTKQKTKQRIK